ncbi:MAG: diaminopimelate epimerase [Bacteroidales bacterium]|nr:diaminopimelate epimerase [Bacteroidales bacterium]
MHGKMTMKTVHFYKYQGAGNDFIIVDNRKGTFSDLDYRQIAALCERRFGIGADGFMMLEKHADYPFCMRFFNSDGLPGSMCGNGGRCICAFAAENGIVPQNQPFKFWSSDGEHEGLVVSRHGNHAIVRLKMRKVTQYACDRERDRFLLDTGSPHYVQFLDDCEGVDVVRKGRDIRFSSDFPQGVNVDFVEQRPDGLQMRTYERGVEDETYSCGTGATAAALASVLRNEAATGHHTVHITTKGGNLQVDFEMETAYTGNNSPKEDSAPLPEGFALFESRMFTQIYLEGLATFVFEADIPLLS